MLRIALALALGFAAASLAGSINAEDKKAETKTVTGKMVCTKCTLEETKTCGHAVKVKEGGKDVVYYLKDKGGKEAYHKGVCPGGSEADVKVTGKVVVKDGKKYIENPKVTVQK
jgi:hypothetical protein